MAGKTQLATAQPLSTNCPSTQIRPPIQKAFNVSTRMWELGEYSFTSRSYCKLLIFMQSSPSIVSPRTQKLYSSPADRFHAAIRKIASGSSQRADSPTRMRLHFRRSHRQWDGYSGSAPASPAQEAPDSRQVPPPGSRPPRSAHIAAHRIRTAQHFRPVSKDSRPAARCVAIIAFISFCTAVWRFSTMGCR